MEWIKVTDKMPEERKCRGHGLTNLLVVAKFAGIPRIEQCYYLKDKGFVAIESKRDLNKLVTHWMYLPEPPSEL